MPKIGLEIHQRIKGGKLFCRCPSQQDTSFDSVIYRKLNITRSELNEIDEAALFEVELGADHFYKYNKQNSCLVELDEEPPLKINEKALTAALAFALSLEAKVIDKITVMRKIVVDGSNVSGFQRTALIGVDGKINTSKGIVKIETLCLEEESAYKDKESYHLWRLGIPLIEISTSPTIKDGSHAEETAEKIGLLLRATGLVERGIGTIRQDLNISVEGGARVEIKGAQELRMIKKWVDGEIKRQEKLIELIKEIKQKQGYKALKEQGFTPKKLEIEVRKNNFLKKAIERGEELWAIKMPFHKNILGKELHIRRYGSELADYAKKAGVGGIIHGDENLEKYGLDFEEIKQQLNLKDEDNFVAVIAKKETAIKALSYVYKRALMDFVPKETRKALDDGSTAFLRPLPGKARLYPETDIPPIESSLYLEKAKSLSINIDSIINTLNKIVGKEYAIRILKSEKFNLFKKLITKYKGEEKTIVWLLEEKKIEWNDITEKALNLYLKNQITKKAIPLVYEELKKGGDWKKFKKLSYEEAKQLLEKYKDVKTLLKKHSIQLDKDTIEKLLKGNKN